MTTSPKQVTSLLIALAPGDQVAGDQLFSSIYHDLRRQARCQSCCVHFNHILSSSEISKVGGQA